MERAFIQKLKKSDFVKNRSRYLLLLPSLAFMIVFAYIPMIGIVIAFQNYDPVAGFFGSPWLGVENFKFFFEGGEWLQVTLNTLYLNALFIVTGTAASIAIAVVMSEIRGKYFKKTAQTLMTLPNFVSWATIALFSVAFLESDGIINAAVKLFGGSPVAFYSDPGVWVGVFVVIRAWKSAGWGAIIYMAAILSIDKEIHEAAVIDGAGRLRRIFAITLPLIKNTVVLMAIMSIGGIFKGDFGMIYPFIGDNAMLYPTTDVIDTYVFRALRSFTNYGRAAAVGLYQSAMGFLLVIVANRLAKRYAPESAIF
ncbi:MAG: ABC transporter permease subunit [Clostridiales bacterium]|nr:ABC transporter permease subunit [Clostridiales bacterium]